ncbi:hypothetical protein [Kordia sp.]|uniref:hypothetical protein n=1 Tax=Kordia sp. TaxID=1965332 RepID=UPI003D6ADE19
MKKRNLQNLALNKRSISSLSESINGGHASSASASCNIGCLFTSQCTRVELCRISVPATDCFPSDAAPGGEPGNPSDTPN